eukprot:TRINITY_DN387_c0_g1_i5.p1 TRINITY_DN387_c0_g1~~TRINITY_DN387_c0_g1_i5.p1  ORF type:complete len:639 (+),score=175.70 TRINITY_DN387_c0_g1_i5:60-1976(+)
MDVTSLISKVTEVGKDLEVRMGRRGGLEAARVFREATEGTATWYTVGKRQVHEPQVEEIVGEVARYVEGVEAIVELGAGKGLLGRVLQEVTKKHVIAIERRDCTTYDGHDVTRLNADLQTVSLNDTIPPNSLVLAKHFCGNATDTAITMICASPKVSLAALAPCCHPQIQWDAYTGAAYLASLGFTPADLPTLLDLVTMSRYTKGISQKDCKRWTELRNLGESTCYQAGRHIRRIIEEGRMRALQKAGFTTCLVQYTPDAVTPDNYLIMATRRTQFPVPTALASEVFPGPHGVVLHANGEQSVPDRIAEYFLEMRSLHLEKTGDSCIKAVEMHVVHFGGGSSSGNSIVVVVIGDPADLLPMVEEPIVARTVDMAIPFNLHGSIDKAPEVVGNMLKELTEGQTVRLCCAPRTLERDLLPTIATEQLSPTQFSHTVFAIGWKDRMGNGCLMASLLPKEIFDVRKWRESVSGSLVLGGKEVTKKSHKALVMFMTEVEKRHPTYVCAGKKVVIVVDDIKDGNVALLRQTVLGLGALSAECVVPAKQGDVWVVNGPAKEYELAIFRLDRGDVPAMMHSVTPYLVPGAPIYGRVKLGVQARARRVTEKLLASWKEAGFKKTFVWHLLNDKESDRTILTSKQDSP